MSGRPEITRGYAAYALLIIFLANLLNYLDRLVVSGLQDVVQERYGAKEGAFGFLWTAFTLGYLLTSPFIGYYADRTSRTRLFALCVAVWSGATVGCGLAKAYWLFTVMRVLIGVGEAGCLVIGPTLVADYFSRRTRGRALSLLFLGTPLGGALGFLAAGQAGWKAFFIAGLAGFAVAAAIFLLREPARGRSEDASGDGAPPIHAPPAPLRSYVELLRTRTFLFIILAQSFAAFTLAPMLHYGTGFLENPEHGLSKKAVTTLMAVIVLVGGPLGNLLGGLLGDRLGRKNPGSYALLAGIGFALALPSTVLGLRLVPHPVSYGLIFVSLTCLFACMPLVNTQIANVVDPSRRAVAYAAAVFVLHILGDTISPPLFGAVTQWKKDDGTFAFTVFPFSLLLSAFFCLLAWRTARADVAAAGRAGEGEEMDSEAQPPGSHVP